MDSESFQSTKLKRASQLLQATSSANPISFAEEDKEAHASTCRPNAKSLDVDAVMIDQREYVPQPPSQHDTAHSFPDLETKNLSEAKFAAPVAILKESKELPETLGPLKAVSQLVLPPKSEESIYLINQEARRKSMSFSSSSSGRAESWPLPFDSDVSTAILGLLPQKSLWAFAAASRVCYLVSLPLLYHEVRLPLPPRQSSFGIGKCVEIGDYISAASVDLSDPIFHTTNYPCDVVIRKALHSFKSLSHLTIKKSSRYASDAVLGSLFRYLTEQSTLKELTFDLDFNSDTGKKGIMSFENKLQRAWQSVHAGAFHNDRRQLIKLNLNISNQLGVYDGLAKTREFWDTILHNIEVLRMDLRGTSYTGSWTNPKELQYHYYVKLFSARNISKLEVWFDGAAYKPYSEIVAAFPLLETLRVDIDRLSEHRNLTELNCLGRLKNLRCLNLPWAYSLLVSWGQPGILDINEEKVKGAVQKCTRNLAHNHRLHNLREVTWKHFRELSRLKFIISWEGGEAYVREYRHMNRSDLPKVDGDEQD